MADADDPAQWLRLASAWIDRLREQGAQEVTLRSKPKRAIIVEYHVFADGAAFHTQDMGWRMTADILFEQIVARQAPRTGRSAEETRLHSEFDSLATRQITYVYLACWRLSVEIELKQALTCMHSASQIPVPEKLSKLLRGHNIAGLWLHHLAIIPEMESALRDTATECALDPSGPGLSLDVSDYQQTIDLLVSIDPDGQSLRYRQNLSGKTNMSTLKHVDVANTQVQFTNLHSYLQRCSSRATSVQQIRECRAISARAEASAGESES